MDDYLKQLLQPYNDANTVGNTFPKPGRLTKSHIRRLMEMKREGETHADIARALGVTPEYVGMIINGHRRRDDVCEILGEMM